MSRQKHLKEILSKYRNNELLNENGTIRIRCAEMHTLFDMLKEDMAKQNNVNKAKNANV